MTAANLQFFPFYFYFFNFWDQPISLELNSFLFRKKKRKQSVSPSSVNGLFASPASLSQLRKISKRMGFIQAQQNLINQSFMVLLSVGRKKVWGGQWVSPLWWAFLTTTFIFFFFIFNSGSRCNLLGSNPNMKEETSLKALTFSFFFNSFYHVRKKKI